jgi:hypothetical protein
MYSDELSEARWTPPSDFCKNPQYWHSDDNESTEHEVTALVAAFIVGLQPEFVLETGTAFGQTAFAIGKALQQNGHGACVSIDTDGGRLDLAVSRCLGLPVSFWGGNALDYKPSELIDFAWVDTGGNRAVELETMHKFCNKGAIVGIHDTGPQHLVRVSLEPIFNQGLYRPIFLRTPRGVCFAEVL